MTGGKEYYHSPRPYFFPYYGATSPFTVTLNPLYITIMLLIVISDKRCQLALSDIDLHQDVTPWDTDGWKWWGVISHVATATFRATRPPRPVDSHLGGSRCVPEKERKEPTFHVARSCLHRWTSAGHSLSEVVIGRWEVCYCQTIWGSFDECYHSWVNLSLQQGHQPGPTRSITQLGFLSCSPGSTRLRPLIPQRSQPSAHRITTSVNKTWTVLHVRNKGADKEQKPQNCFKSITNSSFRQGRPWGENRPAVFTGPAFSFSLSQYIFRCFCKCVLSVCIQSRSGQCGLRWYLFVTSSHHACPLETDSYDPKINGFIVLSGQVAADLYPLSPIITL